jgi:hypothetical protein
MHELSRRSFISFTAMSLGGVITSANWAQNLSAAGAGPQDSLYRLFQDPPRENSIRPFWFWNGDLQVEELRRQMQLMIEQGVYGAYAHCRDGMKQRYLSEEWWSIVQGGLDAAAQLGFSLCLVDEFEWPSGEARDFGLPGSQKSRVLAATPDFHMKRLVAKETAVPGGTTARMHLASNTVQVLAAKLIGPNTLDGDSIHALQHARSQTELVWSAPPGDWIVIAYEVGNTYGNPDHGTVDLMNRDAVAAFITIYYEELKKRCGAHFGKALPATFADHEGTYGGHYPWTPALASTFQQMHGYDCLSLLPALSYDIGPKTEKYRCDLLAAVSHLYTTNFFAQVNDWCKSNNLDHSAHVWEESLFLNAAYNGSFFDVLRAMSNPGCDTLVEWSRQSVWLKENSSVADFERRHVVCENQGVEGGNSYLSPERMRRTSNCLGAWNVGEFIPHAFNYDLARTNFPPDWFRGQPFLPWFKDYADQMRRISFMNRGSHELADILLLYPQTSVWGQTSGIFRNDDLSQVMQNANWSRDAQQTEDTYALLKLRLSGERLAYQVADDRYLQNARVSNANLQIAQSNFKMLILPPMSTIFRSTATAIGNFLDHGGSVIAISHLPRTSPDFGREDPFLINLWAKHFNGNSNANLAEAVDDSLLRHLRKTITPDCEIVDGPAANLFTLRKRKDGSEFYWIVNDSGESRTNILRLRSKGKPERWDAHTGLRAPLFYESQPGSTLVRLKLDSWDAAYIVFQEDAAPQQVHLKATDVDDFYIVRSDAGSVTVNVTCTLTEGARTLDLEHNHATYRAIIDGTNAQSQTIEGPWNVSIDDAELALPYCNIVDDPEDKGIKEQWQSKPDNELPWQSHWLSTTAGALKRWNLIGPFPNPGDDGLSHPYAPETGFDLSGRYTGDEGQTIQWISIDQTRESIMPARGERGIGEAVVHGGAESAGAPYINFSDPLGMSTPRGTVYAQTFVYAETAAQARLMIAAFAPRAVFVNGKEVFSHWLRPFYNELSDAFAEEVLIALEPGWNSIMLKLINNPLLPAEGRFYCRLAKADGSGGTRVIDAVRTDEKPSAGEPAHYRWLRMHVPPLVNQLALPNFEHFWMAFVDGRSVDTKHSIDLPSGSKQITLRVDAREILSVPFRFRTARQPRSLGTWMQPGLEHFSGSMTYEKDVELSTKMLQQGVLLDCGVVGVVAEAWINGHSLGKRAWAPFVFDLSKYAHVGVNTLKVRIANTEANARAVGTFLNILKAIDLDGWHGPARLVPYVRKEMTLHPTPA